MVEISRPLRDDLFIYFSEMKIIELKENFIKTLDFDLF